MDCRAVLRPDLADVRRARPGARPGLRCLSQPGGSLFVEYRWKPRGHPGILRAVIRAGAAWGLVSHKLCRSGLSALSRQGLVAPASPHAWGAGGVFRATYRVAKSARNPLVALLRRRPKQGDRRDRRQQHRSSNNGALRRWRLLLFVDSLAAATNRRSAIPGRSDHRRRIWQRHSARAALWCEQDRWGRD